MPVGGIQHSGCSHYHLTFCCLVFCLLLFNDFNSFFASPRSHLASYALLVLLNNLDTVTRKEFHFQTVFYSITPCHLLLSCPSLSCFPVNSLPWAPCPVLLGRWQPCLNYKYSLRLKQTAGHYNGSDIGEGFG